MESNTNYKLEPEEEKFLDEVSAVFEPVREKYIIREAVSKKVAGSNFRFIDFSKPGGLLAWKYPLIITAIVGLTVGSWFVFKPFSTGNESDLQPAMRPNTETVAPAINEIANGETNEARETLGQIVDHNANNSLVNPEAERETENLAAGKNSRTLQLLTKKEVFSRVEKTSVSVIKTKMKLPANANPAELKQKLVIVLGNIGLKADEATDSGSSLLLRSLPVKGFYSRIDNKPVEFFIEFSIVPGNQPELLIRLLYSADKSADNSKAMDYDMENIFYDRLKSELIKLFS